MSLHGLRKFGELVQLPVDGIFESAGFDFIAVARLQHDHGAACVIVAAVEPTLERSRTNRRCASCRGPDGGVVHADDFGLDLDQPLVKRLDCRPAFLDLKVCKTVVGAQPRQEIMNLQAGGRQKQVDAFFGQQHGAFDFARCQGVQDGIFKGGQVVQRYKFVSCNIQDLHDGCNCRQGRCRQKQDLSGAQLRAGSPDLKCSACLSI